MFAILTAVVFAQATVNIGIGNNPGKVTDSARIERERVADSLRFRREVWRDSVFAARGTRDSAQIERRRAKKIPLSPALESSAFRDRSAASLLAAARKARMEQDSSITGYDATALERMSVGLGFRRIGRERLLMRSERASRILWSRGGPAYVELLGKRAVMPMLEGMGDGEVDMGDEALPIPYYPGRETLWVGSGIAKTDVEQGEVIHPLARGAEAYYTYATGDSVSFQLPGGQRINLRELLVRPRAPKWNVAIGSLWFDTSNAHLVRAVFRMAEPMDIWAIADEEAKADKDDDPPPKWVKAMISPLKAQVNAVTIEYGLHEGRFWMPRVQTLEGSAQAGFMRVPFRMEQSFKYANVNGKLPVAIPQIAIGDTATDSVSRAARIARRRTDCKEGGARSRTLRQNDGGILTVVRTPCDSTALAKSPELPKSIYDEGEEIFGATERDALISEALALGAQPGWIPQKPVLTYGVGMTRFNKIEALSTGIAASQSLGQGYTARAQARIGIADWQPNGELGLWRSNGRSSLGINAYRRLSAANEWSDPFAFGASLSALLFGRDEGFYYRTAGIEIGGTPDDSASTSWRFFAENHSDAKKKTDFSLAKTFGGDGFEDNINATNGNVVGFAAERHGTHGLNPNGFRMFGSARAEGATGSFDYARGMIDATLSRGITRRIDGALTIGAGTSGGTVPVQRLWYLGGSQSVRGQQAGAQVGDAFWMSRIELGSSFVGARPVVFYDVGWAAPVSARRSWTGS